MSENLREVIGDAKGNELFVTDSTMIKMTNVGFDPPSLVLLKAENEVRLEFRLVALAQGS